MLDFLKDGEILYICSNSKKELILKQLHTKKKIYNIKFMSLEEFKYEYFFNYTPKIYPYLMNKYNISFNVSKEYLDNMYYIDIHKNYESSKINYLKEIKKDLIENNLLIFNPSFKDYLSNKKIVVDYLLIDPHIKEILNTFKPLYINYSTNEKNIIVEEYNNIEDEVNNVILKIIKLIEKGTSLNNIFITNINRDYFYTIKKLFNLYNIPIEIDEKISINTSLFIKEYFITKKLPKINQYNQDIINKFITLLNKYVEINDSPYYKDIIQEELNNTYITNKKYQESIKVVDFDSLDVSINDYVFVLGFNEGILPKLVKDEDYLTDEEKKCLGILDSVTTNYLRRENLYIKLTNINNLNLSYKLHSFSEELYPSSIIEDYNMTTIKQTNISYNYSDSYNMRKTSIYLDNYNKYKIINKDLKILLNTYKDLKYDTYNHKYKGILQDSYINSLPSPLELSYTSLNSYNLCPFSYYVKYVLKVDPFLDTFTSFIGNLYHNILSLCFYDNFDFETSFNKYLENRNLTNKEQFLLKRLKKELKLIIEVLKEQKMYTDFKEAYYEKQIKVKIDVKEEVIFKGIIDKLMYYENMSDTYYSVVDYKTGNFPSNLNNLKYGLDMQLAMYIYLVEKSNIFTNPIFTGCYYQKTLLGNIPKTNNKSLEEQINNKLKLRGYSTDDELILSHFDHNYTKSNIISGMSTTDKGFGRFSKILSNKEVFNLIKYTDKIIKESTTKILNAEFDISPKVIDGKEMACKFCKYRDICFKDINDEVKLPKVDDLSFLEGDEVGK